MDIGTLTRSPGDDYRVSVDFSACDVFASSAVTSATATADSSGVTVGSPTVAANVVTFRVSGTTTGELRVAVTATNSASPADSVRRSIVVRTR